MTARWVRESVPEFCPPETPHSAGPDDSRRDMESQDDKWFEGLEQVSRFSLQSRPLQPGPSQGNTLMCPALSRLTG